MKGRKYFAPIKYVSHTNKINKNLSIFVGKKNLLKYIQGGKWSLTFKKRVIWVFLKNCKTYCFKNKHGKKNTFHKVQTDFFISE